MHPHPVRTRLETLLNEHFSPQLLEIKDDSYKHAGHQGTHPEGESHFRIVIVSTLFSGLNRVARTRMVNQIVKPLMETRIHALQLSLHTPEEYENTR